PGRRRRRACRSGRLDASIARGVRISRRRANGGLIMKLICLALLGVLALAARPAFALDPGTASGHYAGDGVRVEVSHAVALALDNAEGELESANRMRVLLSQEDIPPAVLEGAPLPRVLALA